MSHKSFSVSKYEFLEAHIDAFLILLKRKPPTSECIGELLTYLMTSEYSEEVTEAEKEVMKLYEQTILQIEQRMYPLMSGENSQDKIEKVLSLLGEYLAYKKTLVKQKETVEDILLEWYLDYNRMKQNKEVTYEYNHK